MSTDTGTRHKYEYAVDPSGDTAPARVIRMVGHDKSVLEIGSGPGSITRILHGLNSCTVTAVEIDADALKKVAPYCRKALSADLNASEWPLLLEGERFDVVVAADVLEHLYNPLAALRAMKSLLTEHGAIVVSLPHVGHAALVACLLDEDFEYRDWGLLDRTHIRFFGLKNIQTLFEQAGLKLIKAEFVMRHPESTEFVHRWQRLSNDARRVALANPFGQVYQVVVKAVPMDASGDPVVLMNLLGETNSPITPANQADAWRRSRIRAITRRCLREGVRQSIRRVAERLGFRI